MESKRENIRDTSIDSAFMHAWRPLKMTLRYGKQCVAHVPRAKMFRSACISSDGCIDLLGMSPPPPEGLFASCVKLSYRFRLGNGTRHCVHFYACTEVCGTEKGNGCLSPVSRCSGMASPFLRMVYTFSRQYKHGIRHHARKRKPRSRTFLIRPSQRQTVHIIAA